MLTAITAKIMAGLAGLAMIGALAGSHAPGSVERLPSLQQTAVIALETGRHLSVARFEVTEAEWRQCYRDGGCSFLPASAKTERQQDFPVTGVNRFDVAEFIAWVNTKTDRTYRLPTAEEWKSLAPKFEPPRRKKLFDDPRLAWAAEYGSMPVTSARVEASGHFGTEKNGIADLGGNAWEWTSTCVKAGFTDADCPAYMVEGLHETALSVFIRDPASGGCAVGTPPANIGFRLVSDVEDAVS